MSNNAELKELNHVRPFQHFRITARAIIIEDEQILFVSDEGQYWYTPGGQLELNENLQECVVREVYEETGLVVQAGPLLYVQECLDIKDDTHKIHFYFLTTVKEGTVSEHWFDEGGAVKHRQFFSFEAIKNNTHIIPRFLAELNWEEILQAGKDCYQGCIWTKGFVRLAKEMPIESEPL